MNKPIRTRKNVPNLSDHIYKYSPIKRGVVVVQDEDKPYTNFNKILNRIYLGNIEASKDKDFFTKKNIKAVLNCTKEIPNTFKSDGNIEYMRIPIDDSLKQIDLDKALEFMPSAVEFIHKHAALQNNNIFIHCYAGRQRSAIFVAAYLVHKHGLTPKKACEMVIDKRPEAFHFGLSLNFDSSLEKYHTKLQNKN